jgi:hypothetical protein
MGAYYNRKKLYHQDLVDTVAHQERQDSHTPVMISEVARTKSHWNTNKLRHLSHDIMNNFDK